MTRMPELPHVVILGAGPAGLGAAYRLRRSGRARTTVLERGPVVGGNAASFSINGVHVDYGSHRLHPACDPAILADIRALLGDDLRDRPRHGRIRLRGRWVHFPLKPFDLLRHLDTGFALGAARDAASRLLRRRPGEADSFGDALLARLGPTICDSFYFPYARKIWGLEPDEMAAEQAQRRVAANSPGKLAQKVLAQVPGFRTPGAGRFYYPRRGFGQIVEAYAAAAREGGAELLLGCAAREIVAPASPGDPWRVAAGRDGDEIILTADYVWSTIPLTLLAKMTRPAPPPAVLQSAGSLDYRAMVLIYLELPVDRFTEFDAHYFPGADVAITRLSEPKNYSGATTPADRTVLCAELPCSPDDETWRAGDEELGRLVARDLETAGVPLPVAPSGVHVRRLRHAYPIYTRGFAAPFHELDAWAAGLPRLLSFGRQGLFAHDNTHHALAMAYAAVDCLGPDGFDAAKWGRYRTEFEKHVVVD
jgi:protoporphyrinogen oxidase